MDGRQTMIQISGEHKAPMLMIVVLLFATICLLMWIVVSIAALKDTFRETKTEVRILQMHVQDQNAILIRQGIVKPGDLTTGPTDPDKLKVKK